MPATDVLLSYCWSDRDKTTVWTLQIEVKTVFCCLEGVQNGQDISTVDDGHRYCRRRTLLEVSVLRSMWASAPLFMASASALKLVEYTNSEGNLFIISSWIL